MVTAHGLLQLCVLRPILSPVGYGCWNGRSSDYGLMRCPVAQDDARGSSECGGISVQLAKLFAIKIIVEFVWILPFAS
jgi:hypothetical protein